MSDLYFGNDLFDEFNRLQRRIDDANASLPNAVRAGDIINVRGARHRQRASRQVRHGDRSRLARDEAGVIELPPPRIRRRLSARPYVGEQAESTAR